MKSLVTDLMRGLLLSGILVAMPAFAADLKDPTRPPFYRPDTTSTQPTEDQLQMESNADSWVLNSTLISKTQRLAMINGRLLSKGDKVGNMTVVDIKSDKAMLRVNSENIVVTLLRNNIKTIIDDANQKK